MKTAHNFCKNHGHGKFLTLIEKFKKNTSGVEISEWLGVTKQRVSQLRKAFGTSKTTYTPNKEISKYLKE